MTQEDLREIVTNSPDQLINFAVEKGRIETLEELLSSKEVIEYMQNMGFIFQYNDFSYLILQAIKSKNLESFKFLSSKFELDIRQTLHSAVINGAIDILKYIVENKNIEKLGKRLLKNLFSDYVFFAIQDGNLDIVEYILEKSPQKYEHIALKAVSYNQLHIFKYIFNKNKNENKNQIDEMKLINDIIYSNRPDFLEFILENANNKIEKNEQMLKAIIACYIFKDTKTIEILIEHGANNFNECLLKATSIGQRLAMELMIKKGATNIDEAIEITKSFPRGNPYVTKILKEAKKQQSKLTKQVTSQT